MKLVVLLVLLGLCSGISPISHIGSHEKARLTTLFEQNCTPENDVTSLYYSIHGLQLLGGQVPNKDQLCKSIAGYADDTSLEVLFAATRAGQALGCPLKLGSKGADAVKAGSAEGSTTASLYFACNALVSTGQKLDGKLLSVLKTALKDDSLLSLGPGFHVAAMLPGDTSKIFEKIEDAIVQADEVDGKMLQFEGGLSVTSMLLTGAAKLAAKTKKPLPISADQAVKFANYLMSRKSVQQPKGALHLLEGVESMTGAAGAQFTPVSISLASSIAVTQSDPTIKLSVVDLKGDAVDGVTVTIDSVVSSTDSSSLATSLNLKKSSDGLYETDLMALKPEPGFYELTVSAVSSKSDATMVGNKGAKLSVKVLVEQAIKNAELKKVDNDAGTKSIKLTHPEKNTGLTARQMDKIQLTFNVVSAASGAPITVHQAFVKMTHLESGSEIIYVAESDGDSVYKFELDLDAEADLLKGSGKYSMALVLGDAVVSNPITWLFSEIDLDLKTVGGADGPAIFQPKPEITHLFREPEARPAQFVSSVFTLLCLSPFLILIVLWFKLGVNISNFTFSLAAIGFHVGLGSIFLLYVYFFLELNMFETIKYLSIIGVATFIAGNSLLATIAKKNK